MCTFFELEKDKAGRERDGLRLISAAPLTVNRLWKTFAFFYSFSFFFSFIPFLITDDPRYDDSVCTKEFPVKTNLLLYN